METVDDCMKTVEDVVVTKDRAVHSFYTGLARFFSAQGEMYNANPRVLRDRLAFLIDEIYILERGGIVEIFGKLPSRGEIASFDRLQACHLINDLEKRYFPCFLEL